MSRFISSLTILIVCTSCPESLKAVHETIPATPLIVPSFIAFNSGSTVPPKDSTMLSVENPTIASFIGKPITGTIEDLLSLKLSMAI